MQPKNILFETGTPKMLAAALDGFGTPTLPIDEWTQVLDLRNDPDNTVVRRLHLWVHWNYVPEAPDPQEFSDAFVSVIDDTITDPVQAVLCSVANGIVPVGTRRPVKILDDYPIRGPVRVVAGSGPVDIDLATANNMVIFGYYTVSGASGTRSTLDRRPFQIGNTVQVDGALPVELAAAPPAAPIHEPASNYVDEVSLQFFSEADIALYFGPLNALDPRYMLVQGPAPFIGSLPILTEIPMRNSGTIAGLEDGGGGCVAGYISRY